MRRIKVEKIRCKVKIIIELIYNVKDMIKKVKELPLNNVRRYFET